MKSNCRLQSELRLVLGDLLPFAELLLFVLAIVTRV